MKLQWTWSHNVVAIKFQKPKLQSELFFEWSRSGTSKCWSHSFEVAWSRFTCKTLSMSRFAYSMLKHWWQRWAVLELIFDFRWFTSSNYWFKWLIQINLQIIKFEFQTVACLCRNAAWDSAWIDVELRSVLLPKHRWAISLECSLWTMFDEQYPMLFNE